MGRRRRRTRILALAGVLLGLLVVNTIVTDHEREGASRSGPGFVVRAADADLHVQVDGPPKARPLLLLHGLANSSRTWNRLVPLLSDRFRVVRVDLLGHGKSAKPTEGYDPDQEARALMAVVARLRLCRPMLVAHSLGGIEAAAVVAREPKLFSGAVLIGVAPRDGYLTLPFLAKLATAPLIGELTWRTTPDAVVRDQLSRQLAPGSPSLDDQFVEDFRAMTYESFKQSRLRSTEYIKAHPLESIYGASGIPAMAVAGSEDRIVDPAELDAWRRAANVRALKMQGVGHTPQWEQPAKLARLVEGFAAANPLRRRAGCGDSP